MPEPRPNDSFAEVAGTVTMSRPAFLNVLRELERAPDVDPNLLQAMRSMAYPMPNQHVGWLHHEAVLTTGNHNATF